MLSVCVIFNPVFSATRGIGIKDSQDILYYDGFAKTPLGKPAGGIFGYMIRATKIPSDTTRIMSTNTGGLYSIDANLVGEFHIGDTLLVHLFNTDKPGDTSNMVHVVTPEDTLRYGQYLPQLYCDSSLVENRAYAMSVRQVFSPVPGRKFLEFYLKKDPFHRDTIFDRLIGGADSFHFNLEHFPQPANDGDTVNIHIGLFEIVGNDTIFNDSIYLDTFGVVQRWIGRFPNDAQRVDSCWLRVHLNLIHNVGTLRIVDPVGTIDSGMVVTPRAWLKNYGHRNETFAARFKIGTGYDQQISGITLAPGETILMSFPDWHADRRGMVAVQCSTELTGDTNPANDRKVDTVFVRVRDAVAERILAPRGVVRLDSTVIPAAVVRNPGTEPVQFWAIMRIGSDYIQGVPDSLAPGAVDTVWFSTWRASQIGVYPVRCTVALVGDMNPFNDITFDSVVVTAAGVTDAGNLPEYFQTIGASIAAGFFAFRYRLDQDAVVKVAIYSAAGKLVRTIESDIRAPGVYQVQWDGRDNRGKILPGGVYYCRFTTERFNRTVKVIWQD